MIMPMRFWINLLLKYVTTWLYALQYRYIHNNNNNANVKKRPRQSALCIAHNVNNYMLDIKYKVNKYTTSSHKLKMLNRAKRPEEDFLIIKGMEACKAYCDNIFALHLVI